MKLLALALCGIALVNMSAIAQSTEPTPVQRGTYVTKALSASRLESPNLTKDNAVKSEDMARPIGAFAGQYDHATTELGVLAAQKSQEASVAVPEQMDEMQGIQVRFFELYSGISDDTLVAISKANIAFAPSSTFAGLSVYNSHGKPMSRLIGKAMHWDSGVNKIGKYGRDKAPAYSTFLVDDQHKRLSVWGDVYAKWGDIKGRIAFDESPDKQQEDLTLRKDALARFSITTD